MIFALQTSVEVLAEFEDLGSSYRLINPTVIIPTPSNDRGSIGVQFHPFLPFAAETSFVISKDKVLFTYEPASSIVQHYQKIHSKIITPSSQIISPR